MAKVLSEPFDKDREFVVLRGQMLWRGKVLEKGSRFPKETAAKRSLRLLYETRAIGFAPKGKQKTDVPTNTDAPAPQLVNAPKPGPDPDEEKNTLMQDNTGKELKAMLDDLGVEYEARANKSTLADLILKARRGATGR